MSDGGDNNPDDGRDNFSPKVKDVLAKKSGYICSFPGCHRLTVGPSADRSSGVSMVGVAAHITAAAKTGPRYDKDMLPEERASEGNGIWMCQTHGKLIDDNESKHTVVALRRWKKQHEDWVFSRVSAGERRIRSGLAEIKLSEIGIFSENEKVVLGRHNIVFGRSDSGKTTFCQAIAALSGGAHYNWFSERFGFCRGSSGSPIIEAGVIASGMYHSVKLSQQTLDLKGSKAKFRNRLHIEVNGGVYVDWPRQMFKVLHFDGQLYYRRGGLKDTFREAIRYLSSIFQITEDVMWDSLREELFSTSAFGYKFRRVGKYSVNILVPDGRSFFLPVENLSHTEKTFALIDIAIKFVTSLKSDTPWLVIFDTGFFARLDSTNKTLLFNKIMSMEDDAMQSIFCVNDEYGADMLKDYKSDLWFSASKLGALNVHAFL
ncbi:hypothetical protein [Azospirillum sp. sgz301742]